MLTIMSLSSSTPYVLVRSLKSAKVRGEDKIMTAGRRRVYDSATIELQGQQLR